jgi:hypothetical protein
MDVGDRVGDILNGPFKFRFVLQPLMAIVLGVRDGRADRLAGRPPFLWSLFTEKMGRKERMLGALRQIALPLALAFVLEAVVEVLLFRDVRLFSVVAVGAVLIALPYANVRGLANRATGVVRRRRHA